MAKKSSTNSEMAIPGMICHFQQRENVFAKDVMIFPNLKSTLILEDEKIEVKDYFYEPLRS